MKCADVREKLPAYMEGSIRESELELLWKHLANCDSCRALLEEMEIAHSRIMEALTEPVDSPDIADAVMARIPIRKIPTARRWVWAYAAAVCVVIALAIYLIPGHRTERYTAQDTQVNESTPKVPQQVVAPPKQPVQPPRVVEKPRVIKHRIRRVVVKHTPVTAPREVPKQVIPDKPEFPKQTAVEPEVHQVYGQTIYTLPPNEDAENIERPALSLVENKGPEQIIIQTQGG